MSTDSEVDRSAPVSMTVETYLAIKANPSLVSELEERLDQFVQAIHGRVSGLLALRWGRNIHHLSVAVGFTHTVSAQFADPAALSEYLVHPAHREMLAGLAECSLDRLPFVCERAA